MRSVGTSSFPVTETAPFAGDDGVGVSFVQLKVLDGVSQTLLVNSSASDNVTMNFDDRQVVNQFLSVGAVSHFRNLQESGLEQKYKLTWNLLGSQSSSSNLYLVSAKERMGILMIAAVFLQVAMRALLFADLNNVCNILYFNNYYYIIKVLKGLMYAKTEGPLTRYS